MNVKIAKNRFHTLYLRYFKNKLKKFQGRGSMSLRSDRWIREMAKEKGMIEPFVDHLVREVDGKKIISFGLSSYGYDLRVDHEFKIFTNLNNSLVDPKNFSASAFVTVKGDHCIIP